MSDSNPTIAEVPDVVRACPLCGAPFQELLSGNKKHTCPEEGGCGGTFLVKKF